MPVQSTVKLGTTYGQGFGKLREERINPPEFCCLVSDAGETWIEAHTSLEVLFCCCFFCCPMTLGTVLVLNFIFRLLRVYILSFWLENIFHYATTTILTSNSIYWGATTHF